MKTELRHRSSGNGFTLIELLLVVVIVAILVSIAVPSYEALTQRTRRSEAREALSDFAARQEQFFLDNKSYAASLADLGRGAATENGFYQISIPAQTATSYTLRATAQAPQDEDTACAVMELTSTGNRTPDGCW